MHQSLLFLLPLSLLIVFAGPGCRALRKCLSHELCITEQFCNKTDDSGRGLLDTRILDRSCGGGLVCCDKEQLESYYASKAYEDAQREQVMGNPWTATTGTEPIKTEDSGSEDYKSCGEQRLCVPRHLCSTGVVNEDGRHIVRPRIDEASNLGCKFLEICCPFEEKILASQSTFFANSSRFSYDHCGVSNPKGLYFDLVGYNDNESLFAQYPWMIAIMDIQGNYVCGGTLIHPQLVLTTAHNVANYSTDSLVARAGEWDLNSEREPHAYQMRRLLKLLPHENFNKLNFRNDIALLVLEKPFQLAPHIQPICLPPTETPKYEEDLSKAHCFATGWGRSNSSTISKEHLLKRIELPVVEHNLCQRLLRRSILGRRYQLDKSFICAGGIEGRDTCQGDGGSPLFCSMPGETNRYYLSGLVSWGIKCAAKDIPSVNTNVAFLKPWIARQVQRSGFNIDDLAL